MSNALRVTPARADPPASVYLDPECLWNHHDRLLGFACALCHSREDAEDLVQDTYVSVLERPRRLRLNDGGLAYLRTALRNAFVSSQRRRARRPETPSPPDRLETAESWVADDHLIESHDALESLTGLPANARQVVIAVDLVGLSYPEAARAIGIRAGTVKSRLARARARIASESTLG